MHQRAGPALQEGMGGSSNARKHIGPADMIIQRKLLRQAVKTVEAGSTRRHRHQLLTAAGTRGGAAQRDWRGADTEMKQEDPADGVARYLDSLPGRSSAL
jgi:hypothetical protein